MPTDPTDQVSPSPTAMDGGPGATDPAAADGQAPRVPADPGTWAMFLLLAGVWGSSFVWIRVGLDDGLAPSAIVSLRTFFGALLLCVALLLGGGRLPLRWDVWKRMITLGLTNIAVPFVLIAWGQQYIPSGMASILNALVPLFTVLIAAVVLADERATPTMLAGLVIGFTGVVVLALPDLQAAATDRGSAKAVLGMAAVALATVSYAVAAVYARRRLTGQPVIADADGGRRAPTPVEISFGSTIAGFVLVTVFALLFERPSDGLMTLPHSPSAWLGMAWLGLLGTGVAYLLFFRIIERWGATRTTLVTYVIPVVAISLGFVVFGERLRPAELAGAVLIIGGVVLVNGRLGLGRRLRPAPAD
jgi:drug/metabolite transporter (DMT)-like permease